MKRIRMRARLEINSAVRWLARLLACSVRVVACGRPDSVFTQKSYGAGPHPLFGRAFSCVARRHGDTRGASVGWNAVAVFRWGKVRLRGPVDAGVMLSWLLEIFLISACIMLSSCRHIQGCLVCPRKGRIKKDGK